MKQYHSKYRQIDEPGAIKSNIPDASLIFPMQAVAIAHICQQQAEAPIGHAHLTLMV